MTALWACVDLRRIRMGEEKPVAFPDDRSQEWERV